MGKFKISWPTLNREHYHILWYAIPRACLGGHTHPIQPVRLEQYQNH